jgi:tRNA U34 5-methylaminomethyl-2-thiouridine-forming methyltransferase MnmC
VSRWNVVRTQDGSLSLAHPVHGQACHSDSGAWLESLERYARACRLAELALRQPRVRLLDVGTGLGWNLAAALHELPPHVQLEVLCLESDPDVIHQALELHTAQGLAEQEPARSAYDQIAPLLAEALKTTVAQNSQVKLSLVLGDARRTLASAPEREFDAVFLDPFSPGVDGELWDWSFLAQIAQRMSESGILSTYTVSMAVRAGLLAAGLRLGMGPRVGRKASGTLASRSAVLEPLPEPLLRKLGRRVKAQTGLDQGIG